MDCQFITTAEGTNWHWWHEPDWLHHALCGTHSNDNFYFSGHTFILKSLSQANTCYFSQKWSLSIYVLISPCGECWLGIPINGAKIALAEVSEGDVGT